MAKIRKYKMIGGPRSGAEFETTALGRVPAAFDERLRVLRVDHADQAIGRMARTGKPRGIYLRITDETVVTSTDTAEKHQEDITVVLRYAWLVSASLVTANEV